MDDHNTRGEVGAAAHAFPDHGLASFADRPFAAEQTPADDQDAQGRTWPGRAAEGEHMIVPGDGTAAGNPWEPLSRRGQHAANKRDAETPPARDGRRSRRDPWLDAGTLGIVNAYGVPDAHVPGRSAQAGARDPGDGAPAAARWLPQSDGPPSVRADWTHAAAPGPTSSHHHAARGEGTSDSGGREPAPFTFALGADDLPGSGHAGGHPGSRDEAAPRGPGQARRQVWTDLAVEAIRPPERIPGVAVEEDRRGLLQISRVRIESEEAELRVGKRRGRYITLEAPGLRRRNAALQEDTARALADELRSFLPDDQDAEILVVGLGNWNATPDALGPRVVGDLLITRHLREQVPEDLRGGLRSLCAVAPGVLGTTGIETGEVIRAIVDRIHPDAMIAVDALASRSIDRIAATIQLADTGIHPGSGVGNDRGDLSSETLGVPVIAVGVPTVVHAFTIASDTIDLLIQRIPRRTEFAGLRAMSAEEKRRLIAEVLTPSVGDLMVTPKEVDILIEDMSRIIAAGINAAVHPKIAQQPTLF